MLPKKFTTDDLLNLNPKLVYEWVKTGHWKYKEFEEWFTVYKNNSELLEESVTDLHDCIDYLEDQLNYYENMM